MEEKTFIRPAPLLPPSTITDATGAETTATGANPAATGGTALRGGKNQVRRTTRQRHGEAPTAEPTLRESMTAIRWGTQQSQKRSPDSRHTRHPCARCKSNADLIPTDEIKMPRSRSNSKAHTDPNDQTSCPKHPSHKRKTTAPQTPAGTAHHPKAHT